MLGRFLSKLVVGQTGGGPNWWWAKLVVGQTGGGPNWWWAKLVVGQTGGGPNWWWAKLVGSRRRMAALEADSRAVDFSLPGLDNKTYSLAESLKGGPVLAAFFKSSCPVCQLTFPFLERFQHHFRETKAHIWAVSQDEPEEALTFATEYGLSMPVLLENVEHNYPASNAYGLTHVPTVFLIGQAGDILQTSVGFVRKELVQMGRRLEMLTGRKGFVPFGEQDEVPEWQSG